MEVLAALDRLNSHARAGGCGKYFIYRAKHLFALKAAAEGSAAVRPVAVKVKCRNCGGTGRFISWYPDDGSNGEPCRTCARSGFVTLKFAEVLIGDIRWHNPWFSPRGAFDNGYSLYEASIGQVSARYTDAGETIYQLADGSEKTLCFDDAGDWRPNRPLIGDEELHGEAAAELLNVVEAWLSSLTTSSCNWRWWPSALEYAVKESHYSLDLGHIDAPCFICGGEAEPWTPEKPLGWHCTLGRQNGHRLAFGMRMCDRCTAEDSSRFPPAPPEAAVATPAVQAWLAHDLRKTQKPRAW